MSSVRWHSTLSATDPARPDSDVAQSLPHDTPMHFAIFTRRAPPGIDRLGTQIDDAAELATRQCCAVAADIDLLDHGEEGRCHARADKHGFTQAPSGTPVGIPIKSSTSCC